MKSKKLDRVILWLAIILLAGQFAFQVFLAGRDAQTTDESVHLLAGYTYLIKRDFRFNPEHPILVKTMAAAPLLSIHPNLPDDFEQLWEKSSDFYYDSWLENRKLGEEFLYRSGNNAEKLLFWGRMPIVLLTLLLGISIMLAVWRFFSIRGALFATVLYVFNPIVTAHGHLITTDIAITLGYFLTILALLCFLKKQNTKNLIWLVLALSFSLLVKFTAIILIPIIIVLFVYSIFTGIIKRHEIIKILVYLLAVSLLSWLIIFACYGFKTTRIPYVESVSQTMIETNSAEKKVDVPPTSQGVFDRVISTVSPVLIPRDYFKGLFMVLTHVEGGHDSYLLGNFSKKGWWYYFPVVFIAKNPLPFLIILACTLTFVVINRKKRKENIFFTIAALGFLLFAMTSKANLGVRHILPIFPLLILLCGNLVLVKDKIFRIAIIVLVGLQIFLFISAYPYYLSYFNELFGGKINGYKTASDSNFDWGRDLKEISAYLKIHNLSPVYVEYQWDGASSLEYYDIKSEDVSLVSSSTVGYLVIGGSAVDSEKYAWLNLFEIYDRITPSVFVYKLNGMNND